MKALLFIGLFSFYIFAADTADSGGKLSHESEAGIILTSGNSDTQTYSVKQETSYAWQGNTVRFTGSYLLGKMSGAETAKKWSLGLRYERTIYENLSAFAGYTLEGDPFAGIWLQNTFDVGGKYDFIKTDSRSVLTELGYRITVEKFTTDNGATHSGSATSHMSRLYAEYGEKWTPAVSTKLIAEYLQSYSKTKDYRFNVGPSLSVLLNEVFSVKLSYLLNFRNVPAVAGKKQSDTTFTTSLVAKF